MTEGGLLPLIRFCMAIIPPNVTSVLSQEATMIAAPGAAALAHSASRIASESSEFTPGSEQLLAPLPDGCAVVSDPDEYCVSPNSLRKFVQSVPLYKLVSSTTAMVCPAPVIPAENSGLKS